MIEMYHSLAEYLFPNQSYRFILFELKWSRRDLPRMRDPRLIPHVPNAIAVAILFLSQIAILVISIKA